MIIFLLLFCVAISSLLLYLVIKMCYRKQIFDSQGGRKIHTGNIPRVGGIAFVPAAMITFLIFIIISPMRFKGNIIGIHNVFLKDSVVVLCSIAIIYFWGVLDDIIGLRYRVKFGYQIITGLILCFAGIYISNIHGILGLYHIPLAFGTFVTIFLLVLSINAFNFIDGIDGLSSGIALLSLSYYAVILYLKGNLFYLLAIVFFCAVLPFFFFNVFGRESRKTKTFMGDAGSTVLGLVLCLLALIVSEDKSSNYIGSNAFALGFTPLLLPFYDVFSVVFYRLIHSKNPFRADNNHFHHKLLRLGLSQHTALVVEIIVFIMLSISTLLLVKFININVLLGCSLITWTLINMLLAQRIKNN